MKHCFLKLYSISFHTILNWMPIDVIDRSQTRRLFFVSHVVRSCFWLVPACSSLLRLVPRLLHSLLTTASQNVLACKFTINQLHVGFIRKWGQVLLQSEPAFLYYKTGQVLLQSRAVFTKWGNFYDKMWAGITEPANLYYKVG